MHGTINVAFSVSVLDTEQEAQSDFDDKVSNARNTVENAQWTSEKVEVPNTDEATALTGIHPTGMAVFKVCVFRAKNVVGVAITQATPMQEERLDEVIYYATLISDKLNE